MSGVPGALTTYEYDPLDRLASLTQSGATTGDKRVNFSYEANGSRFPTSTDSPTSTQRGRVRGPRFSATTSGIAYQSFIIIVGTMRLHPTFFQFDVLHRITEIVDNDGTSTYSYDNRGQLSGASHSNPASPDELYAYDRAGNRTQSIAAARRLRNWTGQSLAVGLFVSLRLRTMKGT